MKLTKELNVLYAQTAIDMINKKLDAMKKVKGHSHDPEYKHLYSLRRYYDRLLEKQQNDAK